MRITWTRHARLDLEQQRRFLESRIPAAARDAVLAITKSVKRLSDAPGLGRPGQIAGTRELVIARSPYLVAYRVHGGVVQVLRVLHGAQRWPDRL